MATATSQVTLDTPDSALGPPIHFKICRVNTSPKNTKYKSEPVRPKVSILTDVNIQPYEDVHHSEERSRTSKSISKSCNTHSIRKTTVAKASALVLSTRQSHSETNDLAKINKNIIVLPLDHRKEDLDKFIANHVKRLEIDIWVLVPLTGLGEKGIEKKLSIFKQMRDCAEREASLPKGTFALQCLVLGNNAAHALENKRAFVERCEDFSSLHIISTYMIGSKDIAKFIQEHANNRLAKMRQILKTIDSETTFCVTFELSLQNENVSYKDRAFTALVELFDDPSSQVRHHFHQSFNIPNVRVDYSQTSLDAGVALEVRPLHADKLTKFISACHDGGIAALIIEHIRVNQANLSGTVEVSVDNRSAEQVQMHFRGQQNASPIPGERPNMPIHNMKLNNTILVKMYEDMLTDSTKTPYDFLRLLHELGCKRLLSEIHRDGYTAMHLAVLHQRTDFFELIFYQNEWGYLRQKPVISSDPSAKHVGFTPRRLAESMSYKSKGHDTLHQYDEIESSWMTMSVLSKAALGGRLELVKVILAAQPSFLNDVNDDCLTIACGSGCAEIVRYLLDKGAKKSTHNKDKESCIHIAAKFGQTNVLKELFTVDLCGQKNKNGYTPLDICAQNGDMRSLEFFRESKFAMTGRSLGVAVKFKKHRVIEFLAHECGVDVNSGADKSGRLPIHHAVIKGDITALNILMDHGADMRRTDKYHKSVFHLAADGNQTKVMELLLQKLDMPTVSRKTRTPKSPRAGPRQDQQADQIAKLQVDKQQSVQTVDVINSKDAFTGKDLLFLVRGKDQGRRAWHWIQLVRVYIHAFTTDLSSGQIDVAKHGAVLYSGYGASSSKEINDKIHEQQNNNLKTENLEWDMTPLHHAVNKNNPEMVALLLKHSADYDSTDTFGNTPVHIAAMRGSLEMIKLFHENGANIAALTKEHKTPLDIAEENGHVNIMKFLMTRTVIARAKMFVNGSVRSLRQRLDDGAMMSRQCQGDNLKLYIIDALRDMQIDINQALLDLGSGPVSEVSQSD